MSYISRELLDYLSYMCTVCPKRILMYHVSFLRTACSHVPSCHALSHCTGMPWHACIRSCIQDLILGHSLLHCHKA